MASEFSDDRLDAIERFYGSSEPATLGETTARLGREVRALRARVAELEAERPGSKAIAGAKLSGYLSGAEAMRERAAAYLVSVADDDVDPEEDRLDGLDVDGVLRTMADEIRALPLTDDAREDGGSDGE